MRRVRLLALLPLLLLPGCLTMTLWESAAGSEVEYGEIRRARPQTLRIYSSPSGDEVGMAYDLSQTPEGRSIVKARGIPARGLLRMRVPEHRRELFWKRLRDPALRQHAGFNVFLDEGSVDPIHAHLSFYPPTQSNKDPLRFGDTIFLREVRALPPGERAGLREEPSEIALRTFWQAADEDRRRSARWLYVFTPFTVIGDVVIFPVNLWFLFNYSPPVR